MAYSSFKPLLQAIRVRPTEHFSILELLNTLASDFYVLQRWVFETLEVEKCLVVRRSRMTLNYTSWQRKEEEKKKWGRKSAGFSGFVLSVLSLSLSLALSLLSSSHSRLDIQTT